MKQTFEVWMTKVDNEIAARVMGMTSADLPDCCYRDWYDDGVSPSQAAKRAIKYAAE